MEIIIIIHQLKQPLAPDYAKMLEDQIMFSSAGGILFGARLRTHLKLYVIYRFSCWVILKKMYIKSFLK